MRFMRQHDADGVTRFYASALDNDRHDARAANDFAAIATGSHHREEARVQTVYLTARVAKSGHFEARVGSEAE